MSRRIYGFQSLQFNHFSRDYVIPSTNNLLEVCKLYLSWHCELVKEEWCSLDKLQVLMFRIINIHNNLRDIKYSMRVFILFEGWESGFGCFFLLAPWTGAVKWHCELEDMRYKLRYELIFCSNLFYRFDHKSKTVMWVFSEIVFGGSW